MRAPVSHLLAALVALYSTSSNAPLAEAKAMSSISGSVRGFQIDKPEYGSCRLVGIEENSENFRYYASIPSADADIYEGCGRCVQVTCADDSKCTAGKSLVAYVLDVSKGAESGKLKVSEKALSELSIDKNDQDVKVSYKMVNCPSSLLSGNVKACLMEGSSYSYIPMQFYNAQKVIKSAKINGFDAKQRSDAFLYYVNTQLNSDTSGDWFKKVNVQMTSIDGETKSADFSFSSNDGCATSNVQFSAASTSGPNGGGENGVDNTSETGGGSATMILAIVGGIAAVIIVIGSIIFLRRRRQSSRDSCNDLESQSTLPTQNKSRPPPPITVVSYQDVKSNTAGGNNKNDPDSPTTDYSHATSPATTTKQTPPAQQPVAPVVNSLPTDNHMYGTEPSEFQASNSFSSDASSYEDDQKYSYSSDMKYSFNSNVSSPSRGPTLPAPIMPSVNEVPSNRPAGENNSELSTRSSFDIDYLRQTEDFSDCSDSFSSAYNNTSYSSEVVTSPQSYVRATTLRRNNSGREVSSQPRHGSIISDSSFGPNSANPPPPQSGRDSGYSRDSLNILEYPYARKSGRHNNVTDVEL